MVKTLAAYFVRYCEIAAHVGCTKDELEDLFAEELKEGDALGQMMALREAHHIAMGRPAEYDKEGRLLRAEIKPSEKMLRFLIERKVPGFARPARIKENADQQPGPILLDLSNAERIRV